MRLIRFTLLINYFSNNKNKLKALKVINAGIFLSLFALMFLLKRLINFSAEIFRIYTASVLACLGIYWFVERLF